MAENPNPSNTPLPSEVAKEISLDLSIEDADAIRQILALISEQLDVGLSTLFDIADQLDHRTAVKH